MRDGWTETSLGDVVELGKGGSWGQDDPADGLIQAICLRGTDLADLIEGRLPCAPIRWIKESELKKSVCTKDMVLIETSGSKCGRSIVLTEEILNRFDLPVIYSNFCRTLTIDITKVTREFVEIWFSHSYSNGLIPSYRATSAMPNLDVKALLRVELMKVPPLSEQKRIVDLLLSVDSYIDALQQQLESAKRSRNAVLHQLLTAGGDDWVEHKLIDVFEIYQPQTIARSLMSNDGEFIVFGANGPIGRYHKFNHEEPEVVVTCRGATCGTINMTPPKTWITGNAMVVSPKTSEVSKDFLFWALVAGVDIQSVISGSAQPQITREGLAPVKIKIPPLSRQKEIVDLISGFELTISHLEESLSKTKTLRSGLLSDLLSGEHEIPASYDQVIGAA
jgi:type I restriction enzyme S subunit